VHKQFLQKAVLFVFCACITLFLCLSTIIIITFLNVIQTKRTTNTQHGTQHTR